MNEEVKSQTDTWSSVCTVRPSEEVMLAKQEVKRSGCCVSKERIEGLVSALRITLKSFLLYYDLLFTSFVVMFCT